MKGDEEFVDFRSGPKLVPTEGLVLKYVLTLSLSKLSILQAKNIKKCNSDKKYTQ